MTTILGCMRLKTFGVAAGCVGVISSLPLVIGLFSVLISEDIKLEEEIKISYLDLFVGAYILVRISYCFTSIMLVVGTIQERHKLVLPWLINSLVMLCIEPLFGLLCLKYILPYIFFTSDESLFLISIGIVFYVFEWYMHSVIHSLYKEIKASTTIQRPPLQPETPDTIFYPDFFKT